MKTAQNHYNVLIQPKSQNDAEKIISMFRGAGMAVRAHRITSQQDLKEQLKDGSWDLLVTDNHHPEVPLAFTLESLKQAKIDLPVLLITEEPTAEMIDKALKLGIQDVISASAAAHFTQAAKREMENCRARNRLLLLEKEHQELLDRAESLLSNSDEAIAYVSDGIIMRTNDNFASTFGYELSELDCASMIDLVSEGDHDRFKNFFRLFAKGDLPAGALVFQALTSDGETFEAHMTLAQAKLDGEPCTQINITTSPKGGSATGGSSTVDAATGLFNRHYMGEQGAALVAQKVKASFLLLQLDEYRKLLTDVHVSGIDALIKDLVLQIEKAIPGDKTVGRFGDNSVAMILPLLPEAALEKAKALLKAVESHICELDGRTVQYTCTCAIQALAGKSSEIIDHAMDALLSVREDVGKNKAQVVSATAKPAAVASSSSSGGIESALEAGLFRLLYQPMMSLQGDEMENYESTIWMVDGTNLTSPDALAKGAKNSKLDRWIVIEATKALSMHQSKGHKTRLVINLTAGALTDDGLVPWLGVAAKAANLSNEMLAFQFQEEDIRNNLKSAIKILTAMRAAKFRVSVTSFGKEPEPFKLLKHLQLDLVRIDERLTATIGKGDNAELKAMIEEAKKNNIKTILPQVDNASALATLWQMGTHYIQGSYLQVPRPQMDYVFTEIA